MKGSTFGPKIFILTSITSLSHPYVSGGGKKIWYEGKNVSIGALDRSVSASVNRTNRIKERISCFTIEGVGIFFQLPYTASHSFCTVLTVVGVFPDRQM